LIIIFLSAKPDIRFSIRSKNVRNWSEK